MLSLSRYQAAESSLLTRRRAQHGVLTLGDEADVAFVSALAELPPEAHVLVRESGHRLGAEVYSLRYHEDNLTEGLALLAEGLHDSGVGEMHLEDAFHRSARVQFVPGVKLKPALCEIRDAFVEGILAGYLSTAYNCDARVSTVENGSVQVDLGAGRDVNHPNGGTA